MRLLSFFVLSSLLFHFGASPRSAMAAEALPLPVMPIIVRYQFWPEQFTEWIDDKLPFSMIELSVDAIKSGPIYDVDLTDRASKKHTYYSNVQAVVNAHHAEGEEAYTTVIAFDRPDTNNAGSVYSIRFLLKDRSPVEWQFIQGSDVMDQGGGLASRPDLPEPVFRYREQAAVAGEGTAVKIGNVVSIANVWREVSKPPYFTAWHGAYRVNTTTLTFPYGSEKENVVSAPSSLSKNATWVLQAPDGRKESVRVDNVDGTHATLALSSLDASQHFVDETYDGSTWHIERIRFTPRAGERHGTVLQFSPALASADSSKMELRVGKERVATGETSMSGKGQISIDFNSPDWVKPKKMVEVLSQSGTQLLVQANAR